MMDTATNELMRQNVTAWCTRNAALLEEIEHGRWETGRPAKLFSELDAMGLLHILYDPDFEDSVGMVAELAHAFSVHSRSLALLVVQQNMAAYLLSKCGAAVPTGWIALPMYDGAAEWPHQVQVKNMTLDGTWRSLPALPFAESALLPVVSGDSFTLVRIACGKLPAGVTLREDCIVLGMRGCPVGDLVFKGATLPAEATLAVGASIKEAMTVVWSQAEVCVIAMRAAMLERSYTNARDYVAERWQGAKMVIEHTLIRRMLADLYVASSGLSEAWRSMASSLQSGKPLTNGQTGAVLQSANDLPRLTSDGIQLLGGNGYMAEYGQERLFRDAKQCEMLLGHPQAKRFVTWESSGF